MENYSLFYPIFSRKKLSFSFNYRIFIILEVFLIFSLLFFLLIQTNFVISLAYQIQSFQKKLNDLSKENKMLEIEFTKNNSLKNIEEKVQQLGFEKIEKIYYLETLSDQVAVK